MKNLDNGFYFDLLYPSPLMPFYAMSMFDDVMTVHIIQENLNPEGNVSRDYWVLFCSDAWIDRHKNNIESYVCRPPNHSGGFFVSYSSSRQY